jgi:hypothetical protein
VIWMNASKDRISIMITVPAPQKSDRRLDRGTGAANAIAQ